MAKSDGTIIIDTSIDTSGFKEGIANFEKQLAGSTEQFSDFGESVGKEFAEGFQHEGQQGLMVGDRITEVDGRGIWCYDNVIVFLNRNDGNGIDLEVIRDGKKLIIILCHG